MTESNRIEFKRVLTDELDIEKEAVAYLNYREGVIPRNKEKLKERGVIRRIGPDKGGHWELIQQS